MLNSVLKYRCVKNDDTPIHVEILTPIDEEQSEDLLNEDDQPITMVPRIVQTAPSPSTEYPETSATIETANKSQRSLDKEINQMESVL